MGKNIVVFSDGTGQDGGTRHNTNVYKLFNLILDRSSQQVSFYDPGLGTGWRKATGNIFGRGFNKNVLQCYEFIFQNFQKDDKIFLFGFSRGAATVRSLSGFLHLFGILPKSRSKLIKQAWKIYQIGNRAERERRAKEFVDLNHNMWANVEFLGVWDTVAALGLPDSNVDKVLNLIVPHGFHDFTLSKSVLHAYHALAIDDVRKAFHPVLFDPQLSRQGQTLRQVWFMGMHGDVGGGYEERELSDTVLEWMVQHAVRHGLHVYKPKDGWQGRTCTPNADGMVHDSRDKLWRRIAFRRKPRAWDAATYGKPTIHQSVELRTRGGGNDENGSYTPWILNMDHETEEWTHLADWRRSPEFADESVQENLAALEGWCTPRRPDRDRPGDGP